MVNHLGTQRLETERLILRKLTIEDASCMFNNWASDDEVTKTLTWPTHQDINITKKVISSWIEGYEKPTFYQWGIELKENHEVIGTITGSDVSDSSIEIGYCISRKYWHKGITTEACKEVIKYFFNEVKIPKLIGIHLIDNPNSGKVMTKCGFKFIENKPYVDKFNNHTFLTYRELINE